MLWLKVEATAGDPLRFILAEMLALADKLKVGIEINMNGEVLRVTPGEDVGEIERDFWRRIRQS